MVSSLFLLLAMVCFAMGVANVAPRINWVSLGLLFWVLISVVHLHLP